MLRLRSTGEVIDAITSDHHFGHALISSFAGRGFDGRLGEMDETLIRRWNEVVDPEETVLHLGDFALGTRAETVPVADRLNGRILLMPGNHDSISRLSPRRGRNLALYRKHFATLLSEHGDELVTDSGARAVVSHYYFSDPYADEAMRALFPLDDGRLLVHGHTHQHDTVRGRAFHVGVDSHNLYPVRAQAVEAWIDENFSR